jgi:triosephosphate isomerase (TIM)
MRIKIIVGNWKMNNDVSETRTLIMKIIDGLKKENNINSGVIICPPFTSLAAANELINETNIKLGAQNLYPEESGAFTGEVSPPMLKSVGCEYVILGHSERRTIFKETDDLINRKIHIALKNDLRPIFCVGETEQERENNKTREVIKRQLINGLEKVSASNMDKLMIAYEPVWAIGTGKNATPDQAEEVHHFIRDLIAEKYSQKITDDLIIQYGGSVNPKNAKELLSQKDIDGALVGGASLKADDFIEIIKSA